MGSVAAEIGRYVGTALVGYLCGSIPSGVLAGKLFGNVDPRSVGSGKTGATNILRTLGPGAAAAVAATDILKGVAPVLLARLVLFPGQPWAETIGGLSALLGHNYSVFIRFKGGRGVVTALGATMVAAPLFALIPFIIGVLLVAITRYVSLGSVVGALLGALLLCWFAVNQGDPAWAIWGVLVGGFIVVAHRDNIERLLAGKERKLGERAL